MKKIHSIIFSAFALTAALVSCSENLDNVEGVSVSMKNEIQITAMLDNEVATKVSAFSSDSLTTSNIKAFYMEAFDGSTSFISISDGYKTGKFTPSGGTLGSLDGNETWTDSSTTPYYWPAGDVKFMAIACSDGKEPAISIASTGLTMTDFCVEASDSTYKTQKDYVAAVVKQNASSTFTVGLNFQHLLSRLSINMWAPSDKFSNTSKLEVVSFCFDSVDVKGNFSFTGTSTANPFYYADGSTSGDKCWSAAATGGAGNVGVVVTDTSNFAKKVDVWNLAAEIPKATSLQNSGKKLTDATPWLNVIPGTNVADSLVVYIKLTPTSGSAYYKFVALDIKGLTTAPVTEYKPGYEYIYNLKLTGQDYNEGQIDTVAVVLENVTVNKWNSKLAGSFETSTNVGNNTLNDIIENAELYSRINLLENVSLQGTYTNGYSYNYPIKVKRSCTLNLNGQSITVAAPSQNETDAPDSVFIINNGVTFVITDESTSKDGAITNSSSAKLFKIVEAAQDKTVGKVVIRGGKFNFDPSDYIEGTTSSAAFSGTDAVRTFTVDFTDPTTKVEKVRTTTVTLSSGTYTVSQTITNKNA